MTVSKTAFIMYVLEDEVTECNSGTAHGSSETSPVSSQLTVYLLKI
jgi:hypothetical protein